MRGPAVVLLLVASLLSGCITLGPTEPVAEPAVAPDPVVRLPTPQVNPTGALGLYVPPGTARLDISWDVGGARQDADPDDADARKQASHTSGPSGILGFFPRLFVLIGPDGERLFVGTPSIRLDPGGAAPDNETRGPPLPKGTVHQARAPQPGLYRLVSFGDIPLPRVTLESAEGVTPSPLTPLPVTIGRTTLVAHDRAVPSLPEGEGTWALPVGSVAVWGDLRGAAADARLEVTMPDGTLVADTTRPIMADASVAGASGVTFGLDRLGSGTFSDPAALDGRTVHWSAVGIGSGRAFGYVAVVGDMPAPPPVAAHDDALEVGVPLEGALAPHEAGAVLLPADARLAVRLAESSSTSRDHASFRVYDATGQRLLTASVVDQTPAYALPAGPLALVNDGPGAIEVVITGAAPTDAVLHELGTRRETLTTSLGSPTGGAATQTLRAVYPAPLLHYQVGMSGTLEDLEVQVLRDDGTLVAALPETYPYPDGYGPCCMAPLFMSWGQPAPWVDPGVHRVQVRIEGGQGEVWIDSVQVDLDALLALVPDGN